ncbi:PREDICTED: ester hydrolase C11orf54 homolog isoform X2 [Vollenhovia emeryi]|uniref:ester hydrolase C11orf54 homolog isoform X2 n=1 Tax=Vollenhovia emeryi TaxID=411798 RepID=UPI0005F38512|nr:PREDICTED: ester hydrolase C11orf54 homolog isoform X2 [Vollenhovia emeryi]
MENLVGNEHFATNGRSPTNTSTKCSLIKVDLPLTTLSEVASVTVCIMTALQSDMNTFFREVNIDIVRCPYLTTKPFNLAGIGLNGNPYILNVGQIERFFPTPQPDMATWNIREILSNSCRDAFIIGAGYAATPYMPYNGHLIMNATYRAPATFTNASRIVFADANNEQRRIKTIDNPDHMMCSFMGNFFVSEGKEGNVLRVRAKRRESNLDIITIMHDIIYRHFQIPQNRFVALGGVLRMRNGRVAHHLLAEEYPSQISTFDDLIKRFQCHDIPLESDLIAVGSFANLPPTFTEENRYGVSIPESFYQFNSFSDYGAGGNFISDTTNYMTEYEGYFNVARKLYSVMRSQCL